MAAPTKTKLDKAEAAFRELKAKGTATPAEYRKAKESLRALRADYRENVRDKDGWSPVASGD